MSGGSFIWTEEQARHIAITQLGTSACGLTASHNVLKALGIPACLSHEPIPARQRNYAAETLVQYLKSRAVAGYTHLDLISETEKLSSGNARGVFVSLPDDAHEVASLLEEWIANKVVPVVCLNTFMQGGDSWHHQMVCGVSGSPPMVLMTNPVGRTDCRTFTMLARSSPFMLVPKSHVTPYIHKLQPHELDELVQELDSKHPWSMHAVGSQVLDIALRGDRSPDEADARGWLPGFDGLVIPWGGLGGLMLFAHKDNEVLDRLLKMRSRDVELPLYGLHAKVIEANLAEWQITLPQEGSNQN